MRFKKAKSEASMNKLKHLQERDYELFRLINQHGFLTTGQIHRLLFIKARRRTLLRRLSILKNKKFLVSHYGLPRGEKIWSLSSLSAKLIGSNDFLSTINKNTLYHDKALNDIRITLESNKTASHWISGHVLKQQVYSGLSPSQRYQAVVPDGISQINFAEGRAVIAIELELFSKSKKRYEKIFYDYSKKKTLDFVWYIVPTKTLGKKILTIASDFRMYNKPATVYWSLFKKVISAKNEILLFGKDNKRLIRLNNNEPYTKSHTKKICQIRPAHSADHTMGTSKFSLIL